MSAVKPISDFSYYKDKSIATPLGENVVWANVLDLRYAIEVVRSKPYYGSFRIFDIEDQNKLIHEEEVVIAFNAQMGPPDVSDTELWSDMGIDFIDNKLNKEE